MTGKYQEYLGDGVYAEVEHGMIKLTTEYGEKTTNTIFMEPEVFRALVAWEKQIRQVALALQQLNSDAVDPEGAQGV